MHIWLIKYGEPLPIEENARRMRTNLFADRFTMNKNDSVLWFTSKFDHYAKKNRKVENNYVKVKDNYHLYLLPSPGYKSNVSLRRYIDHIILAKMLKFKINKFKKPDLIIASLPLHLLSYEAIRYAKKNNVPVIVDVRDPWPDGYLDYSTGIKKKILRFLLSYDFYTMKYCVQNSETVLGCSEEMVNYGLSFSKRKRLSRDIVFYNGYDRPNIGNNEPENAIVKKLESLKGKFIVVYIGVFSEFHDPAIIMDVAELLKDKDIYFVFAGVGLKYKEMEERSKKLDHVHLTGWINQIDIAHLVKLGTIGIAPTKYETSVFPNKAIMYISGGLPVIAAFNGDLRILIDKYNVGKNYQPKDTNALKDAVLKLYENESLCKQMSSNALELYEKHFTSKVIYDNYCEYVRNYLNKSRNGT